MAGLEHYLARTGQEGPSAASPYRLHPLTPGELVEVLEARPEGGGFDRVAINPLLSRWFEDAEGYSVMWPTEDFVAELREKFGVSFP